ncbi:MAG: hypothetical protein JW852_08140 [Spirochaetales bacterium]|nr:hypothetical protein [Spirochaetales bacterium]
MNADQDKASLFVKRLLQNPSLKNLTPLLREEQILQFLFVNSRQLHATLSSASFFPGMNWEQISGLLTQALHNEVDNQLMPEIEGLIRDGLDFSFIQFLREQALSQDKVKEKFYSFVASIHEHREARRELSGAYNAAKFHFVDRYIDEAFDRNEYVHFELTKVQRLKMGKEHIKNYIAVSLFLKPAILLLTAPNRQSSGTGGNGTLQLQFIEKAVAVIKEKLAFLPEQVIRSGLFANGSFQEHRSMDATSRIAAVLSGLCKNYRPNMEIDRGADTAEKSWLNVARRNYKFYGYDVKLLDEFYKIAAENGW